MCIKRVNGGYFPAICRLCLNPQKTIDVFSPWKKFFVCLFLQFVFFVIYSLHWYVISALFWSTFKTIFWFKFNAFNVVDTTFFEKILELIWFPPFFILSISFLMKSSNWLSYESNSDSFEVFSYLTVFTTFFQKRSIFILPFYSFMLFCILVPLMIDTFSGHMWVYRIFSNQNVRFYWLSHKLVPKFISDFFCMSPTSALMFCSFILTRQIWMLSNGAYLYQF